ncbi:MAG: DUF4340 domain-containing protein, partial [Eubacteriales bacterium]|nr:DUF4340 domain-containing protein [Eubacteriales bacterium]
RWSGASGIYMCDAGVSDAFSLPENRLLPIEQPVLAATLIDRVSLTYGETRYVMTFSTDSSGYTSGMLEEPYRYPMDADSVSMILNAIENTRLGAVEGEATIENREQYGMNAPLCVAVIHQAEGAYTTIDETGQLVARQLEEQQVEFVFGRAEGSFTYTCQYEGNVYLVSRLLMGALITGSAEQWITRQPANLGSAEISSLTVQTGSGNLDIRISRTERVLPNNQLETDEDGSILFDKALTLNGEAITEEQWDALKERLSAFTVSGDAPTDWSYQNATPRWTMTLITTGGTVRTISAYAMDAFSDALVVDGILKHYVHVEALAIALGEWMPA